LKNIFTQSSTKLSILDGENLWASKAIDDTDEIIRTLIGLTCYCIQLNIRLENSKKLNAELSLHNDNYNIELETDKWFMFCTSLSETVIFEKSKEVETKLKSYVAKYLN